MCIIWCRICCIFLTLPFIFPSLSVHLHWVGCACPRDRCQAKGYSSGVGSRLAWTGLTQLSQHWGIFLFAFFHTFSCYFIYLVLFLYLFLSYRSESLLSSLQIVFYHFILYAKTLLYAIRFSSWQKEANEANEKRQSKKDRDLWNSISVPLTHAVRYWVCVCENPRLNGLNRLFC